MNIPVDLSDVSPVQAVFALKGASVTLNTKVELLQEQMVAWLQGEHCGGKLLAERKDNVTFISKGLKDVVRLSPHTGSLTFIRATTRFSGFYCVKLKLGKEPHITKRYRLIVYGRCSVR